MRICVVEDEDAVARFLEQGLSEASFRVLRVSTFAELESLLKEAGQEAPSVMILDRFLQGKDSAILIPRIKRVWPSCRILVLSAIGGPQEKGRVLDSGADDYMSKPFALEELNSRIRALLRRPSVGATPVFTLGNIVINPMDQTVDVENRRLDLSRKEFQLLALLVQHPTQVFSRSQLLERIWEIHNDVESNVVEATIKNLRKKLDQSKASVRVLSKRFLGYWIEA